MTVSNRKDQGGETSLVSNSTPALTQQTKQQFNQSSDPLSQELGKAVRGLPALYTRLLAGTITLAVLGTITWAALSQQEQVSRGTGKTVPLQQVQPIQAPISGEIKTVIQENEKVVPGQVLLTLKTDHLRKNMGHIDRQIQQIQTLIRAVQRSSTKGQHHQAQTLQSELKGINRQLELVGDDLELLPGIVDPNQGWLLPKSTRDALKERAQLHMQRAKTQQSLKQLHIQDHQTRHGSLAQVEQLQMQQIELRQQRDQIQHQIDQSTIKAPVAGTAFNVKTTLGQAHVQSGAELMTLSPEGIPLLMQVRFSTKDGPLIHTGMKARVKLAALERQGVKSLMGTVKKISPDSVEPEGETPYYQATLTLDQTEVRAQGTTYHLKPGMAGSVEMITGKQSILSLLLEPITKSLEDSLK